MKPTDSNTAISRRLVLKGGIGGALAAPALLGRANAATGSDEIRIGLVGCGNRGTGAVVNAIQAADGVRLVAMGDLFPDQLAASRKRLETSEVSANVAIGDRAFSGFDAYQKVIACDVNYVILATPAGFRPGHLAHAIAAGKNVFAEKPIAVDATGVRTNLQTAKLATEKGLGIGVGLQRRHQREYIEWIKRIHGGGMGKIVAGRCCWLRGSLWSKPRQPAWSDLEWQLRNWPYFTWLSGDIIVETNTHNIDVLNWGIGTHPIAAVAVGGRQQRTDPMWGHIYDHFAVDFEYPDDVHVLAMCREWENTYKEISEHFTGTDGRAQKYSITGGSHPWVYSGPQSDPYLQEHRDLIASIRAGKPENELAAGSESTLTSIMGRMAAYTGRRVTWDEAASAQENLMPAELRWGPMATPPVAIPGVAGG